MATIRKRENGKFISYETQIRKLGYPAQTRTFKTREAAEKWARMVETEMDRGIFVSRAESERTTLAEALDRYLTEVTPSKKGAIREKDRINRWKNRPLAKCALAAIRGADLAKFRDDMRKAGKAENTIRLELALISSLYETARREWGMEALANPVKMIKAPGGSNKRDRRLFVGEEEYLWKGLHEAAPGNIYIVPCCQFAVETGMRQGEILGLEWHEIDTKRCVAHLSDTKNSDPRDVPLSSRAVAIIAALPRPIEGGRIFPVSQDYLIRVFSRGLSKARSHYEEAFNVTDKHPDPKMLTGMKFHDLRHEAASRLASLLSATELAKMMGWRTIQMAMRYYHPRAEEMAKKLG